VQIGTAVGPYRILRHLGSGGMGSVWLAEDTRLHRQVALKTLRTADDDDAPGRARLMREARAAAALNHPHIATVYDVLENNGQVVIVFEYVEGETLAARLAREPLPAPEAVEVGCQIAKALVVAHAQGIVHRDLKPANVIVTAGGQVKVLDFGIARMLATGTTQTSGGQTASVLGFIGTPAYAAPEQMVSSAVDERADLYALGVMLFEMISGRRPFVGSDPVALASSKLGHDAPALRSTGALIPRDLERLVAALLARDREQRPASAADVLGHLRSIYGTPSTGTLRAGPPARSTTFMVAAVVLLAAVAGFGAWEIRRMAGTATSSNTSPPVVAVLPLANISGDAAKEFISAGIAESLISSLASLPSVTVLSRASVSEARNRNAESSVLARDLGATYLVEGSVQESGGRLRVSLSLVRSDRSVAWADSVDGQFEQIFDLQSKLANALTNALAVRVSPDQRQRMNAPLTSNTEALSAYWRGRTLLERRDVGGNLDAAAAAFSEAISLDREFALAHAALGETYWFKWLETRDSDWTRKAIDEGTTALRLAPDRPEVRYTLAITLTGTGRTDEAVGELERALALQPNYEDARRQLGVVLARQGKVDDAVKEFRQAISLRPAAWASWSAMGVTLFQAARYQEAIEPFTKVTELQPDSLFGYQQLGAAYQGLGDYDRALANYQHSLTIRPNPQAFSNIGAIHHLRGEYQQAVNSYRRALELRPNSHITWRNLGDVYRRLGDVRQAGESYGRAVALVSSELKVDPSDPANLSLGAVYLAKAGRHAEAKSRIGDALRLAANDPNVWLRSAAVHALAGRANEAITALEGAIARGVSISRIKEEDDFAGLRNDPRYTALAQTK
jgi:serine/threonine protein kinase/Flp pilus assembly protein TadD